MNYAILAAELLDDPLARGYAAMSDSAVADSLNATDRPGRVEVPARDIRRYVLLNALWPKIAAIAQNAESDPQARGAAVTLLETLSPNSFDVVSMNDQAVHAAITAMANALIDAGAITEQNRDEVLAMGDGFISRAQEINLGFVFPLDVGIARKTAGNNIQS